MIGRALGGGGIGLTALGFGSAGLGNPCRAQSEDAAMATVIPGARDPAEVRENLRLITQPTPHALWTGLSDGGSLRPDAVPAA